MRSRFLVLVSIAFFAALACGSAQARGPEPALWKIKRGDSTVYLFGSIHALPEYWQWRTKPIDATIASANVFVFESPLLAPKSIGDMRVFLRENGTLPRGKHLSRMLSEEGLADFKTLLSRARVDPDSVNVMRPWLALMVLGSSQVQDGAGQMLAGEGVDVTFLQYAERMKRPVRYFESVKTQLEILHASAPDDDIKGFEAGLHDMVHTRNAVGSLLNAWTAGNVNAIAKINDEVVVKDPRAKQMVLDVRNHNWIPQIERMMLEKQTTFITVGAAHLAGPGSVVDLLCQRGWKVERVKTGTSVPPLACPPGLQAKSTSPVKEIALRF